jgi:hypothetical protein
VNDLPDRILAAIERTARIATAMRTGFVGGPGPWITGESAGHLVDYVVYRPSPDWPGHIVHACSTEYAGPDQLEVARHIAHNGPKATLRRCEADKRTVQRHAPERIKDRYWCTHCERLWPCVEILDRAAAWDVEAP